MNEIVGVWRVKTVGAPFAYHMFAFHSDGTMQQSNPPEGNKDTSDTAGLGVWAEKAGKLRARFEEHRIDRKDGSVTRGVILFELNVEGDVLAGKWQLSVYDPDTGESVQTAHSGTLTGERVVLD